MPSRPHENKCDFEAAHPDRKSSSGANSHLPCGEPSYVLAGKVHQLSRACVPGTNYAQFFSRANAYIRSGSTAACTYAFIRTWNIKPSFCTVPLCFLGPTSPFAPEFPPRVPNSIQLPGYRFDIGITRTALPNPYNGIHIPARNTWWFGGHTTTTTTTTTSIDNQKSGATTSFSFPAASGKPSNRNASRVELPPIARRGGGVGSCWAPVAPPSSSPPTDVVLSTLDVGIAPPRDDADPGYSRGPK